MIGSLFQQDLDDILVTFLGRDVKRRVELLGRRIPVCVVVKEYLDRFTAAVTRGYVESGLQLLCF